MRTQRVTRSRSPQLPLRGREQRQPGQARRAGTLLDGEVLAHRALHEPLRAVHWPVTGEAGVAAGDHDGVERRARWQRPRLRQRDAQLAEPLVAIDRLRGSDEAADRVLRELEDARRARCAVVVRRLREEGRLAAGWTEDAAAGVMWSATSLRAWEELVLEMGWSTTEWVAHTTGLLDTALTGPPRP